MGLDTDFCPTRSTCVPYLMVPVLRPFSRPGQTCRKDLLRRDLVGQGSSVVVVEPGVDTGVPDAPTVVRG